MRGTAVPRRGDTGNYLAKWQEPDLLTTEIPVAFQGRYAKETS
jgi:hypothetical protein